MGTDIIPYDAYHPHLGYTLAITCLAWVYFHVIMTNLGAVDISGINSAALLLLRGHAVVAGTISGAGFVATDQGSSGGMLVIPIG